MHVRPVVRDHPAQRGLPHHDGIHISNYFKTRTSPKTATLKAGFSDVNSHFT